MTLKDRAELLQVMPQDNINEYMEHYGFTLEEVSEEMHRRQTEDESWLVEHMANVIANNERLALELAEDADNIETDVMDHFLVGVERIDELFALGELSPLMYAEDLSSLMCRALAHLK